MVTGPAPKPGKEEFAPKLEDFSLAVPDYCFDILWGEPLSTCFNPAGKF
jgi:hypothetical protein